MSNHHFLTSEEIVAMLRAKRGGKTLKQFADEIGCTFQFVSQVFHGVRIPGGEMLDYLGIEKVTVYRKVK